MMMNIEALNTLLMVMVGSMMTYLAYRMRRVDKKAELSLNRTEIESLVIDKIAPINVLQERIIKDLERIENKLDSLIKL